MEEGNQGVDGLVPFFCRAVSGYAGPIKNVLVFEERCLVLFFRSSSSFSPNIKTFF